jgi:NADH dehydrogenase
MSDPARTSSEKYLQQLGVDVRTRVIVKKYNGKVVTLNNGESIKSKHVI